MPTPTLVDLPRRTTVVRRERVSMSAIPSKMHELLPAVFGALAPHGLAPAGPPFARWYGMDDPIDMAVGIPVAGDTGSISAPFAVEDLPGGRCAVLVHVGPFDQMPGSWKALFGWVQAEGLAPEASWEEYLTDPRQEPDSSKWQTKLCVKVAD